MGVAETAQAREEQDGGAGAACCACAVEELDGGGVRWGFFVQVREDGDEGTAGGKGEGEGVSLVGREVRMEGFGGLRRGRRRG